MGTWFIWLFFKFTPVNPDYHLLGTKLNIRGALFLLNWIIWLILLEKKLLKIHPELPIWDTTYLATISLLLSESVFQLTAISLVSGLHIINRLYIVISALITVTIIGGGISYTIAFHLKKRNIGQTMGLIVLVILACAAIEFLFHGPHK